MLSLTWTRAAAWRMRRHHLDRRAPKGSMLKVASRLCGLHAQVLSSSELTVWARVEGLERGAVQRALWEERTLVKTWAMRGTLHLLPSGEMPLWHAALRTNPRYLKPTRWKNVFGITMEELDRLTAVIAEALEGQIMTREELVAQVARRMPRKFADRVALNSWGTILKPAAFTGGLCFGPSLGQSVRFTHPRTWLPPGTPAVEGDISGAVTRRFLAAYGPATLHDLARWWGGGGVAGAKKWIAALGSEAAAVDLDGTPAWMLAEHAREARELPPLRAARLLPAFDQYVIGASRHAVSLMSAPRSRVYRPQGWVSPVLLVNGRMQGIWRHEVQGSRVEVTVEPFAKEPSWVRRAAVEEAERLAAFLGRPLEFKWKS